MVRKFDNYKNMNWEEEFISLKERFSIIEDSNTYSCKFQAGYFSSNEEPIWQCYIIDKTIMGNKTKITDALEKNSKSLFRVTVSKIKYDKADYIPGLVSMSSSFYSNYFGKKNTKIFLHLMNFLNSISDKIQTHDMTLTLDDKAIVVDFIEKI